MSHDLLKLQSTDTCLALRTQTHSNNGGKESIIYLMWSYYYQVSQVTNERNTVPTSSELQDKQQEREKET